MNLAIIFWFYKEPEVCKNRIEILRKYNPDIKIFGLFGGKAEEVDTYKKILAPQLDDFFVSPLCEKEERFKWINGDVMLLDWYENRGKDLEWDSVFIAQWDLLVFDTLTKQFPNLKKEQIFLSGLRELNSDIEQRWSWTSPEKEHRKDYLAFREYVKKEYNYSPELFKCCLYVVEILPRTFFEKWLMVTDRFIGMLEYKIPTYADIFGIPFYEKNIGVWWQDLGKVDEMPINAKTIEINENYIKNELLKKDGYRMFHPYFKTWGKIGK